MIETGETVDSKIVDHLIVERQTVRSLTWVFLPLLRKRLLSLLVMHICRL
jgi:hypothetical protein